MSMESGEGRVSGHFHGKGENQAHGYVQELTVNWMPWLCLWPGENRGPIYFHEMIGKFVAWLQPWTKRKKGSLVISMQ